MGRVTKKEKLSPLNIELMYPFVEEGIGLIIPFSDVLQRERCAVYHQRWHRDNVLVTTETKNGCPKCGYPFFLLCNFFKYLLLDF